MSTAIQKRACALLLESDLQSFAASLVEALASGADLRDASGGGVSLWDRLYCADLAGIDLVGAGVPVVAGIDAAILAAIDRPGAALDMDQWHRCSTTHCRAGWAVHLAGEAGYALEERVGTDAAGALIYAASGSHPVPDFYYATTAEALADMRARAAVSR